MKPTVMTDEEWLQWRNMVKCHWLTCYAGLGLAGNGTCFADGDFKNENCPKYISEDDFLDQQKTFDACIVADEIL